MGNDKAIMALIDHANIACGFHAGDPLVMHTTISLAKQHNVSIGAHVSYPDIQGFGRRSMTLSRVELIAIVQAQLAMLEGMCKCQQVTLDYVKPHGALYNDMMQQPDIFESILIALKGFHQHYPLVIQGLANNKPQQALADKYKTKLRYEGFADRAYTDRGLLVSRNNPNALLNNQESLAQAGLMIAKKPILTESKQKLHIQVDTICVHSDSQSALVLCQDIRNLISQQGV